MAVTGEPITYQEQTEVNFLGRRFKCLDLSRETSSASPSTPASRW